jgi:hypothetical protein
MLSQRHFPGIPFLCNLKKFNENVKYYHFKMDTFELAIKLITKGTFMASVVLRHA